MATEFFNKSSRGYRLPIYTSKGLLDVIVDSISLKRECENALARVRNNNPFFVTSVGIIVVGKDIISRICNPVPEELFLDFSTGDIVGGFGVIFNSSIDGVAVIPTPDRYRNKAPLSDRQRLTQAHLESVGKLLAANGLVQKGEYKDGWMACLRSMAQMLGIEVPNYVPFKDMRMNNLSTEEMLSNLKQ